MQIKGEINGWDAGLIAVDTVNHIGVAFNATNEYDPFYDVLEPDLGVGNYLQLYFPHPEWNLDLGDNFTKDIRFEDSVQLNNGGILWVAEVESNMDGTVSLSFNLSENIPNCNIWVSFNESIYLIDNNTIITFYINAYNPFSFDILINHCDYLNMQSNNVGNIKLNTYPNPFNDVLYLDYFLPSSDIIKINIVSLLGHPISESPVFLKFISAGLHTFSYDMNSLSSGIYFVQIQSSKQTVYSQITLLK